MCISLYAPSLIPEFTTRWTHRHAFSLPRNVTPLLFNFSTPPSGPAADQTRSAADRAVPALRPPSLWIITGFPLLVYAPFPGQALHQEPHFSPLFHFSSGPEERLGIIGLHYRYLPTTRLSPLLRGTFRESGPPPCTHRASLPLQLSLSLDRKSGRLRPRLVYNQSKRKDNEEYITLCITPCV